MLDTTNPVGSLLAPMEVPAENSLGRLQDCPYCRTTSFRTIVANPRIVACATCGLYRPYPRMDRSGQVAYIETLNKRIDLTQWRTPKYGLPGTAWEISLLKRVFPGLFPGGRILDVGTAEGTFLLGLKEAGARAIGLEPIGRLAEFACSYGLDVRTARFERETLSAGLFEKPFDLVCFRESWYYLPDLQEAFDLLCELLAPDGHIYIKATQGQSIYFRLWPNNFLYRYNPSVEGIPTPAAIKYILTEEGFQIRHLAAYPEKTLWTLGLPFNTLTRLGNLFVDPVVRPLLRGLAMHDRLVLLASKAAAKSCDA